MEHLLLLGLVGGRGLITALLEMSCQLSSRRWCTVDCKWSNSLDRFIEHALQIPLRQGRALEVLDRLDLLGNLHCLFVLYGLHFTLAQLLFDFWVIAQVELGSDEDDWDAGCVMLYLRVPL